MDRPASGETRRRRMPVLAVLFDLDGVLVDSAPVWLPLMNAAAEHFGCPRISLRAFRETFGQGMQADVEKFYRGRTVDEIARYFVDHFREHAGAMRIDPAAGEVLDGVRSLGLRSGVITNTPSPLAAEILGAARLRADVLVGAGDVAREKPAPDMVVRACRLLGVSCDRALVVGDSRYDREAAAAAGSPFVGLRTEGDFRVEDLKEVLSFIEDASLGKTP